MITCDSLVYQPFWPAGGALACDGVSVQSIVERAGTPTYIYSARAIRDAYGDIDQAFVSIQEAEAAIVKPLGDGKFELVGRVTVDKWTLREK